jgi:hypothetical protein
MDLDEGVIHNEGRLKGWALKSRLFWALKWERVVHLHNGVKISVAGPGCLSRIPDSNSFQSCRSGSGIRRLFDPWIRDG